MHLRSCFSIATICIGLLSGCATGYMEVLPERLYEKRPWSTNEINVVGELHVVERGFSFMAIPISIPDLALAIDAAVQDAGADLVANLEVESAQVSALILSWASYTARGDLVVEAVEP